MHCRPFRAAARGRIGAGRIGKLHAENLVTRVPGACVKRIADPILSSASETAARLSIPVFGGDYREVLDDPEIEAVAICSSTNTHAQIIVEAAQAGTRVSPNLRRARKQLKVLLGLVPRAVKRGMPDEVAERLRTVAGAAVSQIDAIRASMH